MWGEGEWVNFKKYIAHIYCKITCRELLTDRLSKYFNDNIFQCFLYNDDYKVCFFFQMPTLPQILLKIREYQNPDRIHVSLKEKIKNLAIQIITS